MNRSKDTTGEQVMITTCSVTFQHQRMDWKMTMKVRRKDMTGCDIEPVHLGPLVMELQSQEGKTFNVWGSIYGLKSKHSYMY